MLNREVFATAPEDLELLNNGVAEVKAGHSETELRTLRYELSTFVCQGQYESGLRKVLETYLAHLGRPEQPGVWISGFYGSGKSHFLKVLKALWTNEPFLDGTLPRGLTHLTPEITEHLRELTNRARQTAGLHAAAGTLGAAASSVRLGILAVVFRSVGLPERYDLASLVMWLRDNGCLDLVRGSVEAAGVPWDRALSRFIVNPALHKAIVEHFPGWTTAVDRVGDHLKTTFPNRTDVSNSEMVAAIYSALSRNGAMPLTLLGIDEVQQFIGDNSDRAHSVQEAVEECSKRFGSSLLLVATGQAAMASTPQLLKLKGRFPIEVQLSDADVDTVVRQIVLRKRPDRTAAVRDILDKHNGEISKHLAGTQIRPCLEDQEVLVADYPLLPVRRRFWEQSLRALDVGGTTIQLRNQLRVVYEAVRVSAPEPLGTVIPADFLYFQLAATLVQTNMLPREVHHLVDDLRKGGDSDGVLKARLVALVFLIGKLPRESNPGASPQPSPPEAGVKPKIPVGDLGVRADTETLADLLVQDLEHGGAQMRQRVPAALQALVEAGQLMQVETEYRVQTRESAVWEADFQKHRKALSDDGNKIGSARGEALAAAFREKQGLVKLPPSSAGVSKANRTLRFHFGPNAPSPEPGTVFVWVRDAWAESENTIQTDAIKAGNESPLVFVVLPNREPDEFKKALVNLRAAETTLQTRGIPSNPEGTLARSAVETRRALAETRLKALLGEIVQSAQVIQAGGHEVSGNNLSAAVAEAVENAWKRLFPKFSLADQDGWDRVLKKARDGDGAALAQVGFKGDADKHPVCHEILSFAVSDQTGAEIRKRFVAPPYGWSQDAIDGALSLLLLTEHLRATTSAGTALNVAALERSKIGLTRFRAETVPLVPNERIAVRSLFQKVGLPCKPNEEPQQSPLLVAELKRRVAVAGGEPPRPAPPSAPLLVALDALSGNALVKRLAAERPTLEASLVAWDKLAHAIDARLPHWQRLEALLTAAARLPVAAEVGAQRDALRDGRGLLTDPDPLPHLNEQLTAALRQGLSAARQRWSDCYHTERASLESAAAWQKLPSAQQESLLARHNIAAVPPLAVGTESEVLASAQGRPIASWDLDALGLPGRFNAARLEAVQLTSPKARQVALPHATLHTAEEVNAWVETVRAALHAALEEGPVVV